MKLTCLALDDEPLALELLADFIQRTPFLSLQAKCDNAIEALQVIHNQQIDVIFSDIQMNDLSGLELARILHGMENRPILIFTTAHDKFAVQGYKVDALDYLLKPYSYEDFLKAASRARQQKVRMKGKYTEEDQENFILFKVEYQYVKVFYDDILYIEGLKDYVKVHTASREKPLLSLISLKALEERLPQKQFMRIHRSYIIALDKVTSLSRNTVQIGQTELSVSENYRPGFQAFFKME